MDISQILRKNFPLLLLASLSVIISGCASDSNLGTTTAMKPAVEISEVQVADDFSVEMESSETEASLDKELEILRQTGLWGGNYSQLDKLQKSIDPTLYDFPIVVNSQVQAYLTLFQNGQHDMFQNWLSRSTKYLAFMQEELKKAGLPLDLAYLSMIESGFNPKAYSKAQAVGLWQFMNGTGKQYDLRVDTYVDERRHVEKSTKAAVAFLADLYRDFGDWHLAVAAYNGGPGRVQTGLNKYGVTSFWDLAKEQYLPLETKRYVPKLIAAIIIAKEPEKYGFTQIAYADRLRYDTLTVGPNLSLEALALISGSPLQTIINLNLELSKGKTPPNISRYTVKIPLATKELASKNLSRLHQVATTTYKTHTVSKKDTLASVCKKYGISRTTLLKANKLRSNKLIAGKNLRIPYSTTSYKLLSDNEPAAIAASGENAILHRIKSGETLGQIAARYNVSTAEIMAWNSLNNPKKLQIGQQLSIRGSEESTSAPVLTLAATKDKKLLTEQQPVVAKATDSSVPVLAARPKIVHKVPSQKPAENSNWYMVKRGDTLWRIAQKFNVQPTHIQRWNNLKSANLQPGTRLKLSDV